MAKAASIKRKPKGREMEILRKNRELLAVKNTITEMKNAFSGLVSRLSMAEERICELEDLTIETSKSERQKEKKGQKKKKIVKRRTRYSRTIGQLPVTTRVITTPGEERGKEQQK